MIRMHCIRINKKKILLGRREQEGRRDVGIGKRERRENWELPGLLNLQVPQQHISSNKASPP